MAEPPRKPFINMNVFISMHVYCVLCVTSPALT